MRIEDPQKMGEMMRARRKQLGFTMSQMAQAVNVSPITIMRLELGRLGYIHERTAKALEVPKRITHRMVSVPVGVMADGSTRPMDEMKAVPMPSGPTPHTSGDYLPGAPIRPTKRAARPIQRRATRAMPEPKQPSIRKRLFTWLAGE